MKDQSGITLFSCLAVRKALDDFVLDAFHAETGIRVRVVYDPTVQLVKRIERGEQFDVMIGVTSSFEDIGDGVIDLATRVSVAKTGVGVAVPPSAGPVPDISTVESFVAALREARSVAYSRTGASGIYFAKVLEELGIAAEINSRATIVEKGFVAETLVDGRADLAIQQMSELLFVPRVEVAGPLPQEVQHYSEFSAALATQATASTAARSFSAFLTCGQAAEAYRKSNLEPLATTAAAM